MKTTAQEIYAQVVHVLSPPERLRLATLILNDLIEPDSPVVDQSDIWTEQDRNDLMSFSLQYASTLFTDAQED